MLSVTDCTALGVPRYCVAKVRLVGDSVTFDPATTPVPLKTMVCGLSAALSVMLTEAARGPIAVGVKVTVIVHFAPGATPEAHVLV